MTTTCRTAADAIARSISHTEIVTLPYDAEIATSLLIECEDNVEGNGGLTEYWGTDEGGNEWRVHMAANVAREVSLRRPDLADGDAISVVLASDPTLTADEVIETLDEAAADHALDAKEMPSLMLHGYSAVTLRPDHDTTPHCDICGAEGVSLATLPVKGIDRDLCEDCEHCADPIDDGSSR